MVTNDALLSKLLIICCHSGNGLSYCKQSLSETAVSIETAALRVFNDTLCTLDCCKEVVQALLDLPSVFDTSDHTILLERLQHPRFGINKLVLVWYLSYLTNRTQLAKIKPIPPGCFRNFWPWRRGERKLKKTPTINPKVLILLP